MAAPDARQPDPAIMHTSQAHSGPHSATPASPTRLPNRNSILPTRSSTLSSPRDFDRPTQMNITTYSRSEDLNHNGINGVQTDTTHSSPLIPSRTPSRPMTPPSDAYKAGTSSTSENGRSDPDEYSQGRRSSESSTVAPSVMSKAKTTTSSGSASTITPTTCVSCSLPLEGAFVRALGAVWHLQCFKCKVRRCFFFGSFIDSKAYIGLW